MIIIKFDNLLLKLMVVGPNGMRLAMSLLYNVERVCRHLDDGVQIPHHSWEEDTVKEKVSRLKLLTLVPVEVCVDCVLWR